MNRGTLDWTKVLSRTLFFSILLTVIVVALYPNLKLPTRLIGIALGDEFYHISAFATLTLVAAQAWRFSSSLVIKLVVISLGLELAQSLAPGHDVQLSDAAASLSGIAFGGILLSVTNHIRRTVLGWS